MTRDSTTTTRGPSRWRPTNRLPPRFTDAGTVYHKLPEEMRPWNGPYTVLLDGDLYVREIHIIHTGTDRSLHFILPDERVANSWLVTRRALSRRFAREMNHIGGRLDGYHVLTSGGGTKVID